MTHQLATHRRLVVVAILCVLAAVALIVLDAVTVHGAPAMPVAPAGVDVCPAGSTKYEAGSGYEYGTELTTIVLSGPTATWTVLHDTAVVTGVCVKAGQLLYWPSSDPRTGTFTTPDGADVSHLVVYLATPTGIELVNATATQVSLTPTAALGAAGLLVGLAAGRTVVVRRRRRTV